MAIPDIPDEDKASALLIPMLREELEKALVSLRPLIEEEQDRLAALISTRVATILRGGLFLRTNKDITVHTERNPRTREVTVSFVLKM